MVAVWLILLPMIQAEIMMARPMMSAEYEVFIVEIVRVNTEITEIMIPIWIV
jgi:hypothetical protein